MWIGYLVIGAVVAVSTAFYQEKMEPHEDDPLHLFLRGCFAFAGGLAWPVWVIISVLGFGLPALLKWRRRGVAKKKQKPVNTENG